MNAMSKIDAPECSRCDDTGVVPGCEVFNAALCKCESGQTLAAPGLTRMSAEHGGPGQHVYVGLLNIPMPEFKIGAIIITQQGMLYNGVKIEDAGRAYRSLMAVLHDTDPNPDDRPPRLPANDVQAQDMALMLERMGDALRKDDPFNQLALNADQMLIRFGLKAQPAPKAWPVPTGQFSLERRHDPHNPANRHNPLNLGRRRTDRE